MFADISPRYDLLNHVLSLNVDRLWRRRLVRKLGLAAGAKALDVCTGTADLALEIAAALDAAGGGEVFATDFTAEMLELAKTKCVKAGSTVTLAQADTMRLPFSDAHFDAITVAFGIRNVVDLTRGLTEMHRVLKPGGIAAILEFSTPRSAAFRKTFNIYFHRVLPRIGGWIAGTRKARQAYSYLPNSVAEFLPPDALSERMRAVGFTRVRHQLLSMGIAAIHVGECAAPAPNGPPRQLLKDTGAPVSTEEPGTASR